MYTYVFISFRSVLQGFNDQPTAQQFESSIRKLMVHNDVVCSEKSNCTLDSRTKVLTVSSNRPSTSKESVRLYDTGTSPDDGWLNSDFFEISQYTEDVKDHSIAYMASVIESRIMGTNRQRIIKCEECVAAFIDNPLIEDEFTRFKARSSNVLQPCKSTFEICKFVDSNINSYKKETIPYQFVAQQMLEKMNLVNLFEHTNFRGHQGNLDEDHRFDFVKKIVDLYMRLRSIEAAKRITMQAHDDNMRQKMKLLMKIRGE